MQKLLGDAGITIVVDLLKLEESEVTDILKSPLTNTSICFLTWIFLIHNWLLDQIFSHVGFMLLIFFLLLLSCLVFYVFGITCMLGRACLALILLWTTMIFFYCKWLLLKLHVVSKIIFSKSTSANDARQQLG